MASGEISSFDFFPDSLSGGLNPEVDPDYQYKDSPIVCKLVALFYLLEIALTAITIFRSPLLLETQVGLTVIATFVISSSFLNEQAGKVYKTSFTGKKFVNLDGYMTPCDPLDDGGHYGRFQYNSVVFLIIDVILAVITLVNQEPSLNSLVVVIIIVLMEYYRLWVMSFKLPDEQILLGQDKLKENKVLVLVSFLFFYVYFLLYNAMRNNPCNDSCQRELNSITSLILTFLYSIISLPFVLKIVTLTLLFGPVLPNYAKGFVSAVEGFFMLLD